MYPLPLPAIGEGKRVKHYHHQWKNTITHFITIIRSILSRDQHYPASN